MDPVLLVGIISGASAIVASVGAQLIGAWWSRKTEKDRIAREEKREEEARTERRAERFNENKRAAFVRYLQLREEYRRVCHRIYLEDIDKSRMLKLNDRARYAGNDMIALVEEISLIDPGVYAEIQGRQREGVRAVAKRGAVALDEWFEQDEKDAKEIRLAMRRALAITEADRAAITG